MNTHHIDSGANFKTEAYDWIRPLDTVICTDGMEAYMWYICTFVPVSFVSGTAAEEYWEEHGDEYING